MINIFKNSDTLCKTFLKEMLADESQNVLDVLLEGKDSLAQKHVARVIKYLICRMKILEKAEIESDAKETYTDKDGEAKERPAALSL